MRLAALKSNADCFSDFVVGQRCGLNQQNHVHEVSHAAVRRAGARQGIGVKFLGKLLFARDHVQRRARNTGKPQPVTPFDDFERLHHSIAYPYV